MAEDLLSPKVRDAVQAFGDDCCVHWEERLRGAVEFTGVPLREDEVQKWWDTWEKVWGSFKSHLETAFDVADRDSAHRLVDPCLQEIHRQWLPIVEQCLRSRVPNIPEDFFDQFRDEGAPPTQDALAQLIRRH